MPNFIKIILSTLLFVNLHASEITTSLDIESFNKDWDLFLADQKIDQSKLGEAEYRSMEFSFFDVWGDAQFPRRRQNIPGMDDQHAVVIPFVENKIQLSDGTEMSASFIKFDWSENEIYHNFIATQAPLNTNVDAFWKMIWDKDIQQIVMVTELSDDGIEQLCYPYIPEASACALSFGCSLEVICTGEKCLLADQKEPVQVRILKVSHRGQEKTLTHYWYRNWKDGTAPNQTLTMTALIQEVARDKEAMEITTPILVHCTAGAGRTGTFIVSYHLYDRFTRGATLPRLFDVVGQLRWQRPKIVSKLLQYNFCYKFYLELKNQ